MTKTPPTRAELVRTLERLRAVQEPFWAAWKREQGLSAHTRPLSTGMCRFSTAFLACALGGGTPHQGMASYHGADPGALARLRGTPGGFWDPRGTWSDHMWLVFEAAEGPTIFDVTADQFGAAPTIVAPADDARYRRNWKQTFTRHHFTEVLPRARGWLAEARARGALDDIPRSGDTA